jgi:hypothetical protein
VAPFFACGDKHTKKRCAALSLAERRPYLRVTFEKLGGREGKSGAVEVNGNNMSRRGQQQKFMDFGGN